MTKPELLQILFSAARVVVLYMVLRIAAWWGEKTEAKAAQGIEGTAEALKATIKAALAAEVTKDAKAPQAARSLSQEQISPLREVSGVQSLSGADKNPDDEARTRSRKPSRSRSDLIGRGAASAPR